MAGTATNYASSATISGPVDIWFDMAVPGAGLAPTLHTDGTPDATANSSCVHAGMLKTGGGVSVSAEIVEKTSDNLAAPYEVTQLTAAMSITGDMLQMASAPLLVQIVPGSTSATPSGRTGVSIGNLSSPNYTTMVAIWAKKTASKYMMAVLYNAYQSKGFDLKLNRKEDSAAEVEFKGLAVTTRAAADTVGAIWLDT